MPCTSVNINSYFCYSLPSSSENWPRFSRSSLIVKDRSIRTYISTEIELGGETLMVKF